MPEKEQIIERVPPQNTMRFDYRENWLKINPVLGLGMVGYEKDTGILRTGDGKSKFMDLPEQRKNK